MRKKKITSKKMKLFGLMAMGSVICLLSPSKTETVEATRVTGSHIGTFDGSTTFTTTSSNGINPGLFIEVVDEDGNLTQYESEEGVITIPDTKEGAYVTQAKLLGKTKYVDEDTGEILDEWEEGRKLSLVSVENPILTTTGKNLFDINGDINQKYSDMLASPNPNLVNGTAIIASSNFSSHHGKGQKIKVERGEVYTCSFSSTNGGIIEINTPLKLNYVVNKASTFTFTAPTDCDEIIISFSTLGEEANGEIHNFQLEQGAAPTPYEPYQSNILRTNEDVTLRGIGDVQDELDLITGEVTERIGEIVLDGSEDESWSRNIILSTDSYSTSFFTLNVDGVRRKFGEVLTKKCDKFPVQRDHSHPNDVEGIHQVVDNEISIRVLKTNLLEDSVVGFKSWLSNNPLSVQFQLTTESIKTVDLSSTYFFKPINNESIAVMGLIDPLVVSITIPTEALSFTLDPNQEAGQQFIAPDFTLTNETLAPLQIELKTFEQTTDILNDILPEVHENWEGLNKKESKDIALALVPHSSDGWLSLNEEPRYVANTSNDLIGTVKGKSSVEFSFEALHGQAFSEVLNPQYRLTFVFGFNQ